MIVLDTSAMVEFLVGADPIAERVRAVVEGGQLAAPHAIDLECAAALRGLVRGKKLPAAEAERALELLGSMRLKRYGHVPLLARIWQLRHNMWPYDAAYVALAEGLDAELVTLDGKIETIPGVMCSIRNLRGLRAISGHRAGELGAASSARDRANSPSASGVPDARASLRCGCRNARRPKGQDVRVRRLLQVRDAGPADHERAPGVSRFDPGR